MGLDNSIVKANWNSSPEQFQSAVRQVEKAKGKILIQTEEAEKQISKQNLRIGQATRKPSSGNNDLVLEQNPSAGARVAIGTSVSLVVSQKIQPSSVEVPNVTNKSLQQVKTLLERNALHT